MSLSGKSLGCPGKRRFMDRPSRSGGCGSVPPPESWGSCVMESWVWWAGQERTGGRRWRRTPLGHGHSRDVLTPWPGPAQGRVGGTEWRAEPKGRGQIKGRGQHSGRAGTKGAGLTHNSKGAWPPYMGGAKTAGRGPQRVYLTKGVELTVDGAYQYGRGLVLWAWPCFGSPRCGLSSRGQQRLQRKCWTQETSWPAGPPFAPLSHACAVGRLPPGLSFPIRVVVQGKLALASPSSSEILPGATVGWGVACGVWFKHPYS